MRAPEPDRVLHPYSVCHLSLDEVDGVWNKTQRTSNDLSAHSGRWRILYRPSCIFLL